MLTYIPDAPLSEITWYKIGGKAKYLFYPKGKKELKKCLAFIKGQELPFFVVGGGSNILIGDNDFDGAVICTSKTDKIELLDDFTIKAGAGVPSSNVAEFAFENSLEGAEFLYKLPGSIGGAAVMNARAYGCQLSDILRIARCVDLEGNEKIFVNKEIEYGYKKSVFMASEYIIHEVELRLEKGDARVIKTKMDNYSEDRITKLQFEYPSAGCTFKNIYEQNLPAGKLIDELGFKGKSVGGARVFESHANFIINTGHAGAGDVLALIEEIKNAAKDKKGIDLELELRLFGRFDDNVEYALYHSGKKKK